MPTSVKKRKVRETSAPPKPDGMDFSQDITVPGRSLLLDVSSREFTCLQQAVSPHTTLSTQQCLALGLGTHFEVLYPSATRAQ